MAFGLGGLDKAAGVDDDDVGLAGSATVVWLSLMRAWQKTSASTWFLGQPREMIALHRTSFIYSMFFALSILRQRGADDTVVEPAAGRGRYLVLLAGGQFGGIVPLQGARARAWGGSRSER